MWWILKLFIYFRKLTVLFLKISSKILPVRTLGDGRRVLGCEHRRVYSEDSGLVRYVQCIVFVCQGTNSNSQPSVLFSRMEQKIWVFSGLHAVFSLLRLPFRIATWTLWISDDNTQRISLVVCFYEIVIYLIALLSLFSSTVDPRRTLA